MMDANGIVIEALLDDVLDLLMLEDSVDEALRLLQGENPEDRIVIIDRELATVEQERSRLVAAIAAGGQLDGLIQALQARETRRAELEARRESGRASYSRSAALARSRQRNRLGPAAGFERIGPWVPVSFSDGAIQRDRRERHKHGRSVRRSRDDGLLVQIAFDDEMQSFNDALDREHSDCASSAASERVPARAIDGTGAAQVPVELSPIPGSQRGPAG